MSDRSTDLMRTLRAADPDRYLSVLYAPQDRRADLLALYAFNAEIAGIRDRVSEPMPGEIRLQWWRDMIEAGTPDAAAGSPVATALLEAIEANGLPRAAFSGYLEARTFDLYDDPMPSRNDLEGYCGETASALIQLAALILDAEAAPGHAEPAGHAGCAQAVAGLLRLMPIHRARGQCYVPADILGAAGGSVAEFLAPDASDALLARVVAAMAALGRQHLTAFERAAGGLPASLRPAFLPVAPVGHYLSVLEKAGAAAARSPVAMSALRRHVAMLRRAAGGWRAASN